MSMRFVTIFPPCHPLHCLHGAHCLQIRRGPAADRCRAPDAQAAPGGPPPGNCRQRARQLQEPRTSGKPKAGALAECYSVVAKRHSLHSICVCIRHNAFNEVLTVLVQEEEVAFVPLAQLHHSGEVTGADTCLRRPIIATASLDRSVRIWNYLDKCATPSCHRACLLHVPCTAPQRLQSPLLFQGLARSLQELGAGAGLYGGGAQHRASPQRLQPSCWLHRQATPLRCPRRLPQVRQRQPRPYVICCLGLWLVDCFPGLLQSKYRDSILVQDT